MSIIQFGTIIENGNGQIELSNFIINAQDYEMPSDEALIELVIERLQHELDELRSKRSRDELAFIKGLRGSISVISRDIDFIGAISKGDDGYYELSQNILLGNGFLFL